MSIQFKTMNYIKYLNCILIIGIFLISSFSYSALWSHIYQTVEDENSIIILKPEMSDFAIDLAVSSILSETNTLDFKTIINEFNNIEDIMNFVINRYRNNMIIIIGHGSENGFQLALKNIISWNNFEKDFFTRPSIMPIIFLSCYSGLIESNNNNLIKFNGEIDSEAGAQISLVQILFKYYFLKISNSELNVLINSHLIKAKKFQSEMKNPLAQNRYYTKIYDDPITGINDAYKDFDLYTLDPSWIGVYLYINPGCATSLTIQKCQLARLVGIGTGTELSGVFLLGIYLVYRQQIYRDTKKNQLTTQGQIILGEDQYPEDIFIDADNSISNAKTQEDGDDAWNTLYNALVDISIGLLIIAAFVVLAFLIYFNPVAGAAFGLLLLGFLSTGGFASEEEINSLNNDDDNDGIMKWVENSLDSSDNNLDSDSDGVLDLHEYYSYYTDLSLTDSDADGYSDGVEVNNFINTYHLPSTTE